MIDRKLIELHQWIVDESEKKPGWWAEHLIWPQTAAYAVAKFLTWQGGWDAAFLFLALVVAFFMLRAARVEPVLRALGESRMARGLFLAITALDLYLCFSKPSGAHAMYLVSGALMTSFYYFAACEAPRPKKRKLAAVRKLA